MLGRLKKLLPLVLYACFKAKGQDIEPKVRI